MSAVTKDRHAVGSYEWVVDQIYFYLRTDHQWPWVRDVFSDTVIVAFDGDTRLFEYPWSVTNGELVLGDPTEVSVEYVTKRRGSPELTGPIVRKDAKRQVAYAAVLVPGEPDSDGEILTAEKIEGVAHGWLEDFRAFDADHSLKTIDAVPVESYIVPADITFGEYDLPVGTWVLATKIRDESIWARVEKGELTGYSIMGVAKADLEKAVEAFKSDTSGAAFKRTLLADLGDDWIAPLVSIVDAPAVPKAKFFALKSETPPPTPETLFSRFKQWLTEVDSAAKDDGAPSEKGPDEMTPEEIQAAVASAVKSELEPVLARLDAIEQPANGETPPNEQPEPDTGESEDIAALKAKNDELEVEIRELSEFRAQVEERFRAAPKSLTGQDGDDIPRQIETPAEYTDATGVKYRRDSFGRAHRVI